MLEGNRLAIAALLVAGTFLVLVVLGHLGAIAVHDHEAVRGVAGGFVPGLIAFLSIVLGINQLVLSQEFGSADDIRERVEGVRDYRQDVEALAGTGPSPVLPVEFLTFVVETVQHEAGALEESVGPGTSPEVREPVETYARAIIEETSQVRESLDHLRSGRINALIPVLEYDDSRQLYGARRLQRDHGDALPPATGQSLSRLVGALEQFSVARTQFRTTYTQRVLARLSRQLLYVGIPALLVAVALGLLPPSPRPGLARLLTVSALLSVVFSPLAVLASYLLRVAVVSERTLAVGPFVSRPGAERTDRELDRRPTDGDGSPDRPRGETGDR